MSIISVADADKIILGHADGFGVEEISFAAAIGRVLAEDIVADRNLPPYDRVTMDGIAISYRAFEKGVRTFSVRATMAAGDAPVDIIDDNDCIELMTGCALPQSTDTVIRYEDVTIEGGKATITTNRIRQGANVHKQGSDCSKGTVVVSAGAVIDATSVGMMASVGKHILPVKKLPGVVIISTGDELVDVDEVPGPQQVRRSNTYTIKAALQQYKIDPVLMHINDEQAATESMLRECISAYDVVLLSGGVSMGKFDFVPAALGAIGVMQMFHKVMQRPGKPFWFGIHPESKTTVFAFPGNPVSSFLCLYRYFIPWLKVSLGGFSIAPTFAVLAEDVTFNPPLQYFLQVAVHASEDGRLIANPVEGNGSGDFSNLLRANAFMELPADISNFRKGEVFRIWPFKQII
jgi:molybdopterin molybdotransferase